MLGGLCCLRRQLRPVTYMLNIFLCHIDVV